MELDDPAASFGSDRNPFYFCHVLRSWDFDSLLILANSASTDVGLIGSKTDSNTLENWEAMEGYQFTMPLDENQDDTWPVSTALDLYSDHSLPSLTPDQSPMPPCPILWILNNKGMLMACDVMSTTPLLNGVQYPSMLKNVSKPLTLSTSGKNGNDSMKRNTTKSVGLLATVTNENKKVTISEPKASLPSFNFSDTPKPSFSFPKVSTDNSLTSDIIPLKSNTAPEIKPIENDSKAGLRNESLSILLTHFNKAHQDFHFDISKLSNFFSTLSVLAESNAASSLSGISNISPKAQTLEEELGLIQNSFVKIESDIDELKSQILHTWAKKEESDRLIKILKAADHGGTPENNQFLGPEAEELKRILNRKKKVFLSILNF